MDDFNDIFGVEIVARKGYVNYHKHSGSSSNKQPDSFVSMTSYIKRALELGHETVSTVEHGSAGDFMKVWKQTKDAGLKFLFGMEIYFKIALTKSKGNHLVLLARNKKGIEEINKTQSSVVKNRNGFWGISDLLKLNKENVYITTSCLASPINDLDGMEVFSIIYEHFQDSLYLEVQPHQHLEQRKWNEKILELSRKYGVKIVAGIDSHYIYPSQKKLREIVLSTKNITYGTEDSLLLDYPSREEVFLRFLEQGILTENEINIALNNTYDFSETLDVSYDDDIKIPKVYKNEENMLHDFSNICNEGLKRLCEGKPIEKIMDYISEIQREIDTFIEGDMVGYPMLCHHILKLGQGDVVEIEGRKYELDCDPALATKTSRGSGGSPLLHNLLGLTTLDRLDSEVPLLFERFISLDRLKAKTIPDLDVNVSSQEAFERACKILLGEQNAYWMYKEETLQIRASIKICAKYYGFSIEKADDMVELYEDFENKQDTIEKERIAELLEALSMEEAKKIAKNERKKIWEVEKLSELEDLIYRYAEQLIGAIIGVSRHPCGLLLYDNDIEKTFGLIKMKDGSICCSCTGETLDMFKFLKLDILKVETWQLIYLAYKNADFKVPDVKEISKWFYDDEIYNNCLDIMKNKLTTTLCQFNTPNGKQKISKYIPRTIGEISDLSAIMRPACASILDIFLNRLHFSYNIPVLDRFLSGTTGCKQPFLIYQEAIMGVLQLTNDIDLSEAYKVLKAISKKKKSVIDSYKQRFLKGFAKYLQDNDRTLEDDIAIIISDNVWQVVEDASSYAFNSAHSLAYAYDFVYGCVAKATYNNSNMKKRRLCLSYFKEALESNSGDKDTTNELLEELPYFNIKLENPIFSRCDNKYIADFDTYTIYRSLTSIMRIGENTAKSIVELSKSFKTNNFIDLLIHIKEDKELKINKAQLKILTNIGFFREFGGIDKLNNTIKAFFDDSTLRYNATSKYEDVLKIKLEQKRDKLYEYFESLENKDISDLLKIKYEIEYLGVSYKKIESMKNKFIIVAVEGTYNKNVLLYELSTSKILEYKYDKRLNDARPLSPLQLIAPKQLERKQKRIVVGLDENGNKIWQKSESIYENWILKFDRTTI